MTRLNNLLYLLSMKLLLFIAVKLLNIYIYISRMIRERNLPFSIELMERKKKNGRNDETNKP